MNDRFRRALSGLVNDDTDDPNQGLVRGPTPDQFDGALHSIQEDSLPPDQLPGRRHREDAGRAYPSIAATLRSQTDRRAAALEPGGELTREPERGRMIEERIGVDVALTPDDLAMIVCVYSIFPQVPGTKECQC